MNDSRQKILLVLSALVVLIAFLGLPETASAQCAMCRTALEQNGGKLVDHFDRAILFLLAMPYLVFGSIAVSWYWKRRKGALATRQQAARRQPAEIPVLLEEAGS